MNEPEKEKEIEIENHILAESFKQDGIDIKKIEGLDEALTNADKKL